MNFWGEKTKLVELAGPVDPPEVYVDVTYEKVYPSNQFIAELRGQTFGVDRFSMVGEAGRLALSEINRKVAETYKGILGILGDPLAGGTLAGPQEEANNSNNPHGAFPLDFYLNDTNFKDLIGQASQNNLESIQEVNNSVLENETALNEDYQSVFGPNDNDGKNVGNINPASADPLESGYGFNTSGYGIVSFDNDNRTFSIPLFTLPDGTVIHQHQMITDIHPGSGKPSTYVSFFSNGAANGGNIMMPLIDDRGTPNDPTDDITYNMIADCGEADVFGGTRCRYAPKYDQWSAPSLVAFINPNLTAAQGTCFAPDPNFTAVDLASSPKPCYFNVRHGKVDVIDSEGSLTGASITRKYGMVGGAAEMINDDENLATFQSAMENHLIVMDTKDLEKFIDNWNSENQGSTRIELVKQYLQPGNPGGRLQPGTWYSTSDANLAAGSTSTYPLDEYAFLDLLIESGKHSVYSQLETIKVVSCYKLIREGAQYQGALQPGAIPGSEDDSVYFGEEFSFVRPEETYFYVVAFNQHGGSLRRVEGSNGNTNIFGAKVHAGYPHFKLFSSTKGFFSNPEGEALDDLVPSKVEGKIASFPPQIDFRSLLDTAVDRISESTRAYVNYKIKNTQGGKVTLEEEFDESEGFTEPNQIITYQYNPSVKVVLGQTEPGEYQAPGTLDQYDSAVVTMAEYVESLYNEMTDSDITDQTRPELLDSDVQDFAEYPDGVTLPSTRRNRKFLIQRLRLKLLNTLNYVDRATLPVVTVKKGTNVNGGESYTSDLYQVISYFYNKEQHRDSLVLGHGHILNQHRKIKSAHLNWLKSGEVLNDKVSTFMGEPDKEYEVNFANGNLKPFEILDRNSEQFFMGNVGFADYFDTKRRYKRKTYRFKVENNPFLDVDNIAPIITGPQGFPSRGLDLPAMFEQELSQDGEVLVRGDVDPNAFTTDELATAIETINKGDQVGSYIGNIDLASSPYASQYEILYGMALYNPNYFGSISEDLQPNTLPMSISPNNYLEIVGAYEGHIHTPISGDRLNSSTEFFNQIGFSTPTLPVIPLNPSDSAVQILQSNEDLTIAINRHFNNGYDTFMEKQYENWWGHSTADNDASVFGFYGRADYINILRTGLGLIPISDNAGPGPTGMEMYNSIGSAESEFKYFYTKSTSAFGLQNIEGLFFINAEVNTGAHINNLRNYLTMLRSPTQATVQNFISSFFNTPYYFMIEMSDFYASYKNMAGKTLHHDIAGFDKSVDKIITNDLRLLFLSNIAGAEQVGIGEGGASNKSRTDFIRFMEEVFKFEAKTPQALQQEAIDVRVNGMEIKADIDRKIIGAGDGMIFKNYDMNSLIDQLKNSEEVVALLNYTFPINRMLYMLTNYIYMKVSERRPGLKFLLNGSKNNARSLISAFASSAETFLKDKETVQMFKEDMASAVGKEQAARFQ